MTNGWGRSGNRQPDQERNAVPTSPNTRLRALLAEADWSGAQLAAALRHAAAEHGQQLSCDRSAVSRWLSSTTPPPGRVRVAAGGALTLRLRAPAERQARTLTRARLAETLLAQGHLDAALPHWRTFLDEVPSLHSTRVTRRLHDMRRLLNPHRRHPGTAELLARAATVP